MISSSISSLERMSGSLSTFTTNSHSLSPPQPQSLLQVSSLSLCFLLSRIGSGPHTSPSSSSSPQFRPLTTSIASGPPSIAPTPTYIPYNYAASAHPSPVGDGVNYYPPHTGPHPAAGSHSSGQQVVYYANSGAPSSVGTISASSAPLYHPQEYPSSSSSAAHPVHLIPHSSPPQLLPVTHYSHYPHQPSLPPPPSSTSSISRVPAPPSHEDGHQGS